MYERGTVPSLRREPFRHHRDDGVELRSLDRSIRPGSPDEREQFVLRTIAARRLRHDLLCEHVERRVVRHDRVELSPTDRSEQGGALDQVVARHGEQTPLRQAGDGVSRAADALQERRDPVRRSDLADEVDRSDVDAEL
ncbi:MAG: hypothetical protein DMG00_10115, partial [Acidobacteria bacterium]